MFPSSKKKYLLYIQVPEFKEEKQKSALVNLLLARHYDYYKPGTLIEEIQEDPKRFNASVVGNKELSEIIRNPDKLCKHGYSLETRMCKHGCR